MLNFFIGFAFFEFGALCGFFGKRIDSTLMRIKDVIMSIPGMMLAI